LFAIVINGYKKSLLNSRGFYYGILFFTANSMTDGLLRNFAYNTSSSYKLQMLFVMLL